MKTFIKTISLFFILAVIANQYASGQSSFNELSISFDSKNSASATVVGEQGTILVTKDGGSSWVSTTSGVSTSLNGVVIIDEATQLSVGDNGIILRSSDAGITWSETTSGTSENMKSIKKVNSTTAVACGSNGVILTTHDAGVVWTLFKYSDGTQLNDLFFVNDTIGYICGNNGVVLKSTDNGDNWFNTQITSRKTGTENLNSISGFDENNLTVVGNSSLIKSTTDGGATWTTSKTSFDVMDLHDVVFLNSTNGVICGDNGIIVNTTDGGLTWNPAPVLAIGNTVPRNLMSVAFSSSNSGYAIGVNGYIISTVDGGLNWAQTNSVLIFQQLNKTAAKNNIDVKLNQNYPNPFNPSTVISFNLPFSSVVSLKVYDMIGREVTTLINGMHSAGTYSYKFDGANLSSGIYFYVLRATEGSNSMTKTMRMILTK